MASPEALRLTHGTPLPEDWPRPFTVKPDAEDNSLGLTLVDAWTDLRRAVATALAHGGAALAEAFVPGREVRLAVLDEAAGPRVPADHGVSRHRRSPDPPTRRQGGRGGRGRHDRLLGPPEPRRDASRCAPLDAAIHPALAEAALAMHEALGCRDYSLYDFRVDAAGRPWLLEACSFWTFTPFSVISRMLAAEGAALEDAALAVWRRAAGRGRPPVAPTTGRLQAAQ